MHTPLPFSSTHCRTDLWRYIPPASQRLYPRRGGLSEVTPVATDGTHFLAFIGTERTEHVGHVTNLINPDPVVFFKAKPKAASKPKLKPTRSPVEIDLSFLELDCA